MNEFILRKKNNLKKFSQNLLRYKMFIHTFFKFS